MAKTKARHGFWLLAACLLQAFVVPPKSSADEPGMMHALTLADLESMASQSNPTLLQAIAAVDQTRGSLVQAGRIPNPQVGYLRTDADKPGQARSQGIFAGQEFVTAKKLQKAQAVQAAAVDQQSWQYHAQTQRVMNDVRIRYFDVLGAERSVQVSANLVKLAEEGLKATEKLHDARQASRTDVLQARIQLKTVQLARREAEIRQGTAWKQLTHVVGVPELPLTAVAGTIDGDIPERNFQAAYQTLLSGSPQLHAAEARIGHARAELVSEQAQVIPNVTVQVVAERDQINQYNSVNTFLSVPLPIFNRNQGNILHAQADIREACQEVERTKLALRDSLAEAFQRYETAREQVKSLRDEILPDAEESLKLSLVGYESGEISILQVLSARQTYFQNSLAYIQAWTEVRKVVTEIDGMLLTGALNPAELGTALQGTGLKQQGLLNQMQESSTRSVLPAAVQTGAGGP